MVLLVDDYDDGRRSLAEFLATRGFTVETAADGREAVEKAKRVRPAIVIMDLAMPVMDGWEATRELKAQPETSSIPVIALTAYGHEDAHRRAMEAGCAEVITKPVDPPRLEERIRHHFAPRRPASSAVPPSRGPHQTRSHQGELAGLPPARRAP